MPRVIVMLVKETLPPVVMLVLLRIRSASDVPALPSMTHVPPLVVMRNHVAVPLVMPVVADGNVGDRTALAAAGANGLPMVNEASLVVATPHVEGRTPS